MSETVHVYSDALAEVDQTEDVALDAFEVSHGTSDEEERFVSESLTADDGPVAQLPDALLQPDDLVGDYFRKIGKTKLLTPEGEVDLAKRIEAGLYAKRKLDAVDFDPADEADLAMLVEDGIDAKQHFMAANARLVVKFAKKYMHRGLAFEDLIGTGNTGLGVAVEKFDYTKGYKFSTYAAWWIRQSITRALAWEARAVRLPVAVEEALNTMYRSERQLELAEGREPTEGEVAADMDMTIEQIRELKRLRPLPLSFERPLGEEEGATTVGELLTSDEPLPEDYLTGRYDAGRLAVALADLEEEHPRGTEIIRLYFGFEGGEQPTLTAIGKRYGLSHQRVSQIRDRMLGVLYDHPALEGIFE